MNCSFTGYLKTEYPIMDFSMDHIYQFMDLERLFIVLFTKRFKKHPIAIFLLSIPITGILEYITGYVMYEIWTSRWWDYRNLFLNIDGYVCLRSVLSFAFGAMFLIYLVEPFICILSNKMSIKMRHILCIGIIMVFIIDSVLTVLFRMPAFA